jgi:hypothetical protein
MHPTPGEIAVLIVCAIVLVAAGIFAFFPRTPKGD